jgi:hypothetical protein
LTPWGYSVEELSERCKAARRVLLQYDADNYFATADTKDLARVLCADANLVATVQSSLINMLKERRSVKPSSAPEALQWLSECVELASYLGVDGETVKLIVSDSEKVADCYADLARAGNAILGAFRAKCPDERVWQDKVEPYEDRIRTRKRSALVDHILSAYPEFKDTTDLFSYFLFDVGLEGCARTSRVVAAISSVQLYVHRILMNLEQSATGDIKLLPECIPAAEWDWRKHYRVWEANRKVFLYPEHYIEPELRDDKTPLFKELESTLLQQEINEQTVIDAYASYMTGFEEVAGLKIAGAYHDINLDPDRQEDTLHLFGVTPGDPPTYYYRAVQYAYWGERPDGKRGVVWAPWQKIQVQIPVRKVAPVVYRGKLYVFWVEITTMATSEVTEGKSEFTGYQHKMALKYTSLRLDGTWTAPQRLSLKKVWRDETEGVLEDTLWDGVPFYDTVFHGKPKDGYTLTGFPWEQAYPHSFGSDPLTITGPGYVFRGEADFYTGNLLGRVNGFCYLPNRMLYTSYLSNSPVLNWVDHAMPGWFIDDYAFMSLIVDGSRGKAMPHMQKVNPGLALSLANWEASVRPRPLANLSDSDQLAVINCNSCGFRYNTYVEPFADAIIDSSGDLLLLQGSSVPAPYYRLKRLGTTLSETVIRTLVTGGVDALLDTSNQMLLGEAQLPFSWISSDIGEASQAGNLDFKGAYGTYYREIFFHIPFLIANHLNSQQRFAAAGRWYHYVFNPTASETTTPPTDRNWRYREFRGLGLPVLRDILRDTRAIEVCKSDPFNPHAIARLRLSAYQKCIVMKYIDNLLDWGDNLFNQFTTESVNEATLLYILATDVLGERPVELGECGECGVTPRNYETIAPLVKEGSPFLIEMENYVVAQAGWQGLKWTRTAEKYTLEGAVIRWAAGEAASAGALGGGGGTANGQIFKPYDWKRTRAVSWNSKPGEDFQVVDHDSPLLQDFQRIPDFGWSLVRQVGPVLCIPGNKDLLAYWDRVEDRLFKIRNCMDIAGVKRELALFAPEIDPRLLVRMKAAGLSLEDVLNATSGDLPPYRFAYLIEKAKQYAAAVQGFGAALLSALEKKDIEELSRLRTVHQQNMLKRGTDARQWEIDTAKEAIQALNRQKEIVDYRKSYYKELLTQHTIPAEKAQASSRLLASIIRGGEATLGCLAGVFHLLPEIGSPFAMKYGGRQPGDSSNAFAIATGTLAAVLDEIAASAGLMAGFSRREQGWEHQYVLADKELLQIDRQIKGAEIRRDIAVRSLELHQQSIAQIEEIDAFYADKFSNFGLYTWLSTTLHGLYRAAYNSALAMARLAEQAYRFERNDDMSVMLQPGYWDTSKAGLLAGERLLIDLQNLERRFIETNYRSLEIDQAFSLTQLDPVALIQLRETGKCTFSVPEIFFDLFYPGHYRRRIKSARLTIPCVTGPYTNVSATLRLTGSRIRKEPKPDAALVELPLRRTVSIATSAAQNDGGVFELNFRDERYMPFEGAGAISDWELSLPANFRQFDYQTINDVILHISYTAEEDGLFRQSVEQASGAIEACLKGNPLARLFSLRQEFSTAFHRLLHSPANTAVKIEISDKHFPIFIKPWKTQVTKAKLVLKKAPDQTVGSFEILIDGSAIGGANQIKFEKDGKLGNLWAAQDLGAIFASGVVGEHVVTVKNPGDLAPGSQVPGELSALDAEKLIDVILLVEYKIVDRKTK